MLSLCLCALRTGYREKLSSSRHAPIHPSFLLLLLLLLLLRSSQVPADRQIEPFVRGLLLQGKSPSACNAIRGRPTPHSQNLGSGSLQYFIQICSRGVMKLFITCKDPDQNVNGSRIPFLVICPPLNAMQCESRIPSLLSLAVEHRIPGVKPAILIGATTLRFQPSELRSN